MAQFFFASPCSSTSSATVSTYKMYAHTVKCKLPDCSTRRNAKYAGTEMWAGKWKKNMENAYKERVN